MIVFINIFHTHPDNQQKVVNILEDVTRSIVSKAPGFLSSTLHRGSDGTKVAMYARWASLADYEAMRRDPAPGAALARLTTLATFEASRYEMVAEFTSHAE